VSATFRIQTKSIIIKLEFVILCVKHYLRVLIDRDEIMTCEASEILWE
jgi:hypothetical protein